MATFSFSAGRKKQVFETIISEKTAVISSGA
jgi:hypothetical protein